MVVENHDVTMSIKYASKDVDGKVEQVELILQAGELCSIKSKATIPPNRCKRGNDIRS